MTTAAPPETVRVLIVDDDSQLLRTMADMLRMRGYEPHMAGSGASAIATASGMVAPPAIAVVDLRLPDMSGLDLVTALHRVSDHTECVILTGYASLDSAVQALRERSCDYLVKPVAPEQLFDTLGRASERWHRRAAEDALRQGEERFRHLIENILDVIAVVNPDGTIQYVSQSVKRMLDLDPSELVGKRLDAVIHADDFAAATVAFSPTAPGDTGPSAVEVRLRHRNGQMRTCEMTARDLLDEPGVRGTVLAFHDVTRRRILEEQFRQAQKMEAVGRLAGGVAHDFNNLLTAIQGYTDLLTQDTPPSDPRRADLDEIRKAAVRASGLTQQLLAFSRRQLLQPRVLDLNAVVRDVAPMLSRIIGEDIVLTTHVERPVGSVRADPVQMEQVLLNLAVNARDAMPDGGSLTIETAAVQLDARRTREGTAPAGSYVKLSVSDTGTGIDPDTLSHLFEPFFTTKPAGRGTGLGLATVYGIVKQSGGQVEVYSEVGVGSTFSVYLPRTEAIIESRGAAAEDASRGGRETILLVEDDAAVRGIATKVLSRKGYRVVEANGGKQALEVLTARPDTIDLVVTDLVMPGMRGSELVARMAQQFPRVRAVYTSGYAQHAAAEQGDLDPGVVFLQKPFTPESLSHAVREALDKP